MIMFWITVVVLIIFVLSFFYLSGSIKDKERDDESRGYNDVNRFIAKKQKEEEEQREKLERERRQKKLEEEQKKKKLEKEEERKRFIQLNFRGKIESKFDIDFKLNFLPNVNCVYACTGNSKIYAALLAKIYLLTDIINRKPENVSMRINSAILKAVQDKPEIPARIYAEQYVLSHKHNNMLIGPPEKPNSRAIEVFGTSVINEYYEAIRLHAKSIEAHVNLLITEYEVLDDFAHDCGGYLCENFKNVMDEIKRPFQMYIDELHDELKNV